MDLLIDLLKIKPIVTEPAPIVEARGGDELSDLVEKYMDMNRIHHLEGDRGIKAIDGIIKIMGYRSMHEFQYDNSGCNEAIVEWIKDQNIPEWIENFKEAIASGEKPE